MKLAASGYLIPFLFCYNPAILLQFQDGLLQGMVAIILAALTVFSLSILLYGYYFTELGWSKRVLAFVSTAGFVAYFWAGGIIVGPALGIASLALLTVLQWQKGGKFGGI